MCELTGTPSGIDRIRLLQSIKDFSGRIKLIPQILSEDLVMIMYEVISVLIIYFIHG